MLVVAINECACLLLSAQYVSNILVKYPELYRKLSDIAHARYAGAKRRREVARHISPMQVEVQPGPTYTVTPGACQAQNINEVGVDILTRIFSNCDPITKGCASSVCTFWHDVLHTSSSWEVLNFSLNKKKCNDKLIRSVLETHGAAAKHVILNGCYDITDKALEVL